MKSFLLLWLPPSLAHSSLFGITTWQLIGLFLAVLIGLIISTLITTILANIIKRAYTTTIPQAQSLLSSPTYIRRPLNIILMGWIWLLTISSLGLSATILTTLTVAAKVMTYSGIVWCGWRLTDIVNIILTENAAKTATKFDDILIPLITRSLKIVVAIIGFVSISEILKMPLSSILAGLGIGGIAIAMAAKETIANIFGSLTILVDRPFNIGDWIKINDVEGTVEDLGFRSTRVRTFYNSLITIPNSSLITASIDNMGKRQYRRIYIKLGILYSTPPEKIDAFCKEIRALIKKHPNTRKDYFHVYLNELSDFSIQIMVYCFLHVPTWEEELQGRHDLLMSFLKAAQKLDISFAFPTQTIHLETPSDNPPLSGTK